MTSFKEIVTKAVIGKAKKTCKSSYVFKTETVPNTILGCWVINHSFNGVNQNQKVIIDGSFDVNVWYSHDADTKTSVTTKTFTYQEEMNMDKVGVSSDVVVRCLKQPTVTNVEIVNEEVNINVEKEMGVELVGETKVKIVVEDSEDDYIDLTKEEEIDEVLDELTDDYIN